MTQDMETEDLVRHRIRGLRVSKGWSLDSLAARCHLSASSLSRIETGQRRLALDQLVLLARALGTSVDQLVEPTGDDDVVIRPEPHGRPGATTWILSRERMQGGTTVAKMRLDAQPEGSRGELMVHPGREWFTVLSGRVRLQLGERIVFIEAGQAASFSTMTPHRFAAHGETSEILSIFDHDGERAHLQEA